MSKKKGFLLLIIIIITTAAISGCVYAYYMFLPPSDAPEEPVIVTIKAGEPVSSIAATLHSRKLIKSPAALTITARIKRTSGLFQKGTYSINPGMSALEIHDFLVSGNQVQIKVTIPEGAAVSQIADRLEYAGITDRQSFLDACYNRVLLDEFSIPGESAEGYLFPDTYLFQADFPADMVVRHMITTFFDVLKTIEPDYGKYSEKELNEKVILASIIEREYRSPEEAPLIASVFVNRLEAGRRLESCATVAYVMTEEKDMEHPEYLTFDDLQIESDYNTYKRAGLPPGPIANPGKTAIDAAFNPAETDYWYFVLKGQGSDHHYFSKTYSEHLEAQVVYLKQNDGGN